MSEVPRNVPAMTDTDMKWTDHVYYGIASLRGWYETLHRAHRWEGTSYQGRVGRLLSTLLLAGGDDRVPVAISGAMDDNQTGHLALLYPDVVVLARTHELTEDRGEFTVTLHPLTDIRKVRVEASHNYYAGTTEWRRESGMELHVTVDGQDIVFPGRNYEANELTNEASAAAAVALIRQRLGGVTTHA